MTQECKTPDALSAHFAQMGELAKRLTDQFVQHQDAIQECLRAISERHIEANKRVEEALEQFAATQRHWADQMNRIRIPILPIIEMSDTTKPIIECANRIHAGINAAFADLQKTFDDLPSQTQEALLILGDHGWFVDLDMSLPEIRWLKNTLSKGNVSKAEKVLADHFSDKSKLDEIERLIITKFPHRERLIKSAFGAHRREEYELSIPVLLAQVDGICKEVTEHNLFRKNKYLPMTSRYVKKFASDAFQYALLQPLAHSLPISASEKERGDDFNALNRHMVLHGESVDYGTKINSLKSISLLNYVVVVLTSYSGTTEPLESVN